MSAALKVILAEPSAIIRSGMLAALKRLSELHLEVFETADLELLRKWPESKKVDVLIINPALPGVFSLPQVRKEIGNQNMKCIALQSSLIDGFLLKPYDEVISVYDSMEQIKEKLTQLIQAPEPDKRHESLSPREVEVIVCVVKGLVNKQIADRLGISTHTVITHRRNIAAKLQIHSTAGLTIYAIVNKLVELGEISNNS